MNIIKQAKVLNYKNLKKEKYYFKQPFKTSNNYYTTPVSYCINKNDKLPFIFETPKLKTINGIVRVDNDFYLDLELSTTGDIGKFYDFLVLNDEYNIRVCHENSQEWFGHLIPLHMIEKFYKSPILLKSEGRLPILRIRVPNHKGNVLCEIFNDRKEQIFDYESIEANDMVIGIIEFTGLMFMNQTFIANYELHKLKVFKDIEFYQKTLPNGYIFSDSNEKIDIIDNKNNNIKTILDYPIKESIENIVTLLKNSKENENIKEVIQEDIKEVIQEDIKDEIKYNEIETQTTSNVSIIKDSLTSNTSIINNITTLFDICKNTSLKNLFEVNDFMLAKKENIKHSNSRSATPTVYNTIEEIEDYDIPFGVDGEIDDLEDILESDDVYESDTSDDIDYNSLNELEMIVF
jgi:hypothetical protein